MINLSLLFAASFFIIGLNYCIGYSVLTEQDEERVVKKNVFWFVGYYGDLFLPSIITKPLYGCVMCMASFWGSVFYWNVIPVTDDHQSYLIQWVVFCVALCGLNRLLKSYF